MISKLGYLLYLFSVRSYFLLVRCLSPFHARAGKLWTGQQGLMERIRMKEASETAPRFWFHVSSLGEFEQGRPVMEALKKSRPGCRLVVTFFSPSGYEQRQNDELCDAVYYLPFETKENARKLVKILNPLAAFWVKYDFWYEYICALNKKGIPVFLLAAQFRNDQIFFQGYGAFKRNLLKQFTWIFCQNEASSLLLSKIGITHQDCSGDNRFDRVYQTVQQSNELEDIRKFTAGRFTLILGSSYDMEEALAEAALKKYGDRLCILIAPHFTDSKRIESIKNRFKEISICYSDDQLDANATVLIIDRIGLLARLYRYGHAALIGGGFKENGLHNILEAAAFGMPIAFGGKIKRFPEAQELVQQKIASTIKNSEEFCNWLEPFLADEKLRVEKAERGKNFIAASRGATAHVMKRVEAILKTSY